MLLLIKLNGLIYILLENCCWLMELSSPHLIFSSTGDLIDKHETETNAAGFNIKLCCERGLQ